ncbi:hypothetical protein OG306_05030 [Streptomyces sp. NBC_01241]|nr:hypothetical protein OG306_05030 [Streptomyces sp. NBC_01241]
MEAGRTPHGPALTAPAGELGARNRDSVRGGPATRCAVHGNSPRPVSALVGALTLDVQQFSVDTHPGQQLITCATEPGSSSHEALRLLLQWSAAGTGRQDEALPGKEQGTIERQLRPVRRPVHKTTAAPRLSSPDVSADLAECSPGADPTELGAVPCSTTCSNTPLSGRFSGCSSVPGSRVRSTSRSTARPSSPVTICRSPTIS